VAEFILSLPAMAAARAAYPAAQIYLMASKSNLTLVKGAKFIDCFVEYGEAYRGYRGAWRLARLLRREKIDCAVALNPKKEFHLAFCLAGVKIRAGYRRKWGFCLNRAMPDLKHRALRHETEYNNELAALIGVKPAGVYEFPVDAQADLSCLPPPLNRDGKYIVIHPFTSNPEKLIGDKFWQVFCAPAAAALRRRIVIVGAAEEKARAQHYAQLLGAVNLAGCLDLRQLACFLKYHCCAFLGLDSGPMHLSAAVGAPTAGIFRVSLPQRWGPKGRRAMFIEGKDTEELIAQISNLLNFFKGGNDAER